MKKLDKRSYLFGFMTNALIVGSLGVGAAIIYNAKDIKYTPSDSSWTVTNVEEAINDIKNNYIAKSKVTGQTWSFDYTGDEQTFIVPATGIYKLETWGAQGGTISGTRSYSKAYGAYSVGEIELTKGDIIYITVGGMGKSAANNAVFTLNGNGYNGGGIPNTQESTNYYG